jgi:hypothetical protein
MHPIELTHADDQYVDYCLWDYTPIGSPVGKLRSINLLLNSFEHAGLGPRATELVHAIRIALGPARTVWGIKQEDGRIFWELYFYDYERQNRSRSITGLLAVIAPWMPSDLRVNEARDYFMFSIDLSADLLSGAQQLDELQMYIGNVGSTVSSGICYSVTKSQIAMKNFYFFFDARSQSREIVDKVVSSAYLDLSSFQLDAVLWPELRQCKTIVVANKRTHDGIYFSRVNLEQLRFFLGKMAYPQPLIDFVDSHQHQLDHLLYDVGFDYRMEDGVLRILKSAYYGVF